MGDVEINWEIHGASATGNALYDGLKKGLNDAGETIIENGEDFAVDEVISARRVWNGQVKRGFESGESDDIAWSERTGYWKGEIINTVPTAKIVDKGIAPAGKYKNSPQAQDLMEWVVSNLPPAPYDEDDDDEGNDGGAIDDDDDGGGDDGIMGEILGDFGTSEDELDDGDSVTDKDTKYSTDDVTVYYDNTGGDSNEIDLTGDAGEHTITAGHSYRNHKPSDIESRSDLGYIEDARFFEMLENTAEFYVNLDEDNQLKFKSRFGETYDWLNEWHKIDDGVNLDRNGSSTELTDRTPEEFYNQFDTDSERYRALISAEGGKATDDIYENEKGRLFEVAESVGTMYRFLDFDEKYEFWKSNTELMKYASLHGEVTDGDNFTDMKPDDINLPWETPTQHTFRVDEDYLERGLVDSDEVIEKVNRRLKIPVSKSSDVIDTEKSYEKDDRLVLETGRVFTFNGETGETRQGDTLLESSTVSYPKEKVVGVLNPIPEDEDDFSVIDILGNTQKHIGVDPDEFNNPFVRVGEARIENGLKTRKLLWMARNHEDYHKSLAETEVLEVVSSKAQKKLGWDLSPTARTVNLDRDRFDDPGLPDSDTITGTGMYVVEDFKDASEEVFLGGVKDKYEGERQTLTNFMQENEEFMVKTAVLDYLITNKDRHHANIVINKNGKPRLIDNGGVSPVSQPESTSLIPITENTNFRYRVNPDEHKEQLLTHLDKVEERLDSLAQNEEKTQEILSIAQNEFSDFEDSVSEDRLEKVLSPDSTSDKYWLSEDNNGTPLYKRHLERKRDRVNDRHEAATTDKERDDVANDPDPSDVENLSDLPPADTLVDDDT